MSFIEYNFSIDPTEPAREVLVAELSERGFDSFVETETGMLAYITVENHSKALLEHIYILENPEFKIDWTIQHIEQQNWNAEWEKNFEPIEIDDTCRVRAPFHPKKNVPYEICIAPKMSFGTGHHETTFMMLKLLLGENVQNKTVLDMGCGTGVLAILTEMMGAGQIDAIDFDDWCVENTTENMQMNHCKHINVKLGDASILGSVRYDLIIANINRNTLLEDIPVYVTNLKKEGILLLSGFYLNDLDMISSKCEQFNLRFEKKLEKNNWVAAKYVH